MSIPAFFVYADKFGLKICMDLRNGTLTASLLPTLIRGPIRLAQTQSPKQDMKDPRHATGKSTIALGLVHLLAASPARVGVFKPIVRSTDEPDDFLELLTAALLLRQRPLRGC